MKNNICLYRSTNNLNSRVRRILQNPHHFLKPFIKKGMNVLDYGCGTGFCTFDIAELLQGVGSVMAVDLQQEMLDSLNNKINNNISYNVITTHKCEIDRIGIDNISFDFILLFYMFHEVSYKKQILNELKGILKPDGIMMISEPMYHVKKTDFVTEMNIVCENGFEIIDKPKIFFSRTCVLKKQFNNL